MFPEQLEQRLMASIQAASLPVNAVLLLAVDDPEWGQRLVALPPLRIIHSKKQHGAHRQRCRLQRRHQALLQLLGEHGFPPGVDGTIDAPGNLKDWGQRGPISGAPPAIAIPERFPPIRLIRPPTTQRQAIGAHLKRPILSLIHI